MKSNSLINSSLAALSVANIVFIASAAQAQVPPVVNSSNSNSVYSLVRCNAESKPYPTTEAYQNGFGPVILFEWKSKEFGSEYTPLTRCRTVSENLNKSVQNNGSLYVGLRLTNGPVNGRVVICVLGSSEIECNSSNQLFTLSRKNEKKAGYILGQLLNIGQLNAGVIREDSGEQVVVDLGEWAKNNFRESPQNSLQQQNPVIEQPKPVQNSGGFR